jgi:hypothetical protein
MPSRLLVALLLVAPALHAAQPRIGFAPRAVAAGETVTVRWENLPREVEELEFLLLREEGGKVRLTPQLSPSRGSFRWTVPSLPSDAARLVLRAGIGGEEITLAVSHVFAIRAASDDDARLEFRDREWWAYEMRPPAGEERELQRVPKHSLRAAPFDTPPRPDRLKPVLQWADAHCGGGLQPAAPDAMSIDTRSGAPCVVPQRK